ncbi:Mediator of RNA polymerase II transcription subunit 1 [Amazona aestiva]|uniref:Mediator of RNA polymerase II transcription subunit 1 n=1 Tax=Amazona aestiva TaxID=12930 RepID=A0A0Q3MIE1_AMAAE|nr:Mediator of RNA polymerase II transcription subunit 1 [Amazona aestiva]
MFCHGTTNDSSTNALMEKLHLKYRQRPWTETLKLVHFCMDKPRQPDSNAPDGPLLSCMEKIQRMINAKPLFSVMNRLESLAKQKGLNAHVSPSGTTCYITSNMFYVEVQLEMDGKVVDVKLAHLGDAPVVCDDMAQHLSDMKAKGYHALQALEKDLYSMSLLHRFPGIQITALKLAPLYELIVQSTLKEKGSEDVSTYKSHFFVSLPGCPKHCYFINNGSEKSDSSGALVSKIPFSHPQCVPDVIEILRHQVAYNSLISSCVSDKHINEVTINIITSREIQCHLHLNPQDPTLDSSDDFITRAVKRCMSVPVVMRAIFRNAAKVKAARETQDVKADKKQKPEPPCEQVTHSDSPEDSHSVAGQQDLVVTHKPSITDSPKENLSTAKPETLGDNTEKSNPTVSTEALCGAEESNSTASTEAVMTDKKNTQSIV